MNKAFSLVMGLFILSAASAHASTQLVGVASTVVDAKNYRFVDFKASLIDSDKETEMVPNPNYGCSADNGGSNCDQKLISLPKRIPGYVLTIQFDSAKNGDQPYEGDSVISYNKGTREVAVPATELPRLVIPKKRKDRVALAHSLLAEPVVSRYHANTQLAYNCHVDNEGHPTDNKLCYAPHAIETYTLLIYKK